MLPEPLCSDKQSELLSRKTTQGDNCLPSKLMKFSDEARFDTMNSPAMDAYKAS